MVRLGLLATMGVVIACLRSSAFSCADDGQCVAAGTAGVCQSDGFCSFPDPQCASGLRYDALAGDGLAGLCVGTMADSGDGAPDPGDTTTTTPMTTSSTGGTTSTSAGPTTSTPTTAVDDTGGLGSTGFDGDTGVTTTGGPPGPDPYRACTSNGDCGPQSECFENGIQSHCAPFCMPFETPSPNCPQPMSGTAIVSCSNFSGQGRCFLLCANDSECPDGMNCGVQFMGDGVCVWG